MTKRIELSEQLREQLLNNDIMPSKITVNGKEYNTEAPVVTGFKAAIWKVRDQFNRRRALKLCLYDDYNDRSYLQELSHASVLEPYSEFARFVDAGLCELTLNGNNITFVGFVEEWIDGNTLHDFLIMHPKSVTSSLFMCYVHSMGKALHILKDCGLRHDDLHSKNVMLAKPPSSTSNQEWSVKVIDTGSMKLSNILCTKAKDDHLNFVSHLVEIWNVLYRRKSLPSREYRFLSEAEKLLKTMVDDDMAVALRDPSQIIQQFELAFTRATTHRRETPRPLNSPFEYISAEHIADDRILVNIFASSCPWLPKVDSPDPCLVTGPRGCGKSTIFRWLSLKAHLHKPFHDIDSLQVAGFYISCSSDLQNRLGWIISDDLAKRFQNDIIHYFNLLVGREVIYTLSLIAKREDRESAFGIGQSQEQAICTFIERVISKPIQPRLKGVSRFVQVLEVLEGEMFSAHSQMLRGNGILDPLPETFLGDLSTFLVRNVSFFASKQIAFLVDDFSTHRLPGPVQSVLNRVIWERRASHVFKLSSEKHGAILDDIAGATVDITREMVEIDCGREYIALDDSQAVLKARIFAIELLDNRLKAAEYNGCCEQLIGHSSWSEGSLARALSTKPRGRISDQYHGVECIADLCSGDVSTLLYLYRRIFESSNVTKESTSLISKTRQHASIVGTAREMLDNIRHHFPNGPEMYTIANEFGNLVRNILQDGRWQKKGDSTVPTQCPRIELDQKHGSPIDQLNEQQYELARELLRRAVFIEMEPGLSRHGNVTTLRWQIRRVFLPHFGASLSKNDAVKEPVDWLKYFLTDPKGACDQVWGKWPKKCNTINNQHNLFDSNEPDQGV